jgi:uncharacterized protein YciI
MTKPLLLGIILALLGCQANPKSEQRADGDRGDTYTLVLLKTGPRTELTKEELQPVFAGHFSNMQRLAELRELLVAGPYGQTKHDPSLRGLFILDEPTLAGAEVLAGTDPGVKEGVFELELHELVTAAPLRAYLEHELSLEAAAKAEGRQRAPGEGGRTYVLLTAEDGAMAERALGPLVVEGTVLLLARMDGTRLFALLDAVDVPAAEALLGVHRAGLGPHVLDQWFASGELARLASFDA